MLRLWGFVGVVEWNDVYSSRRDGQVTLPGPKESAHLAMFVRSNPPGAHKQTYNNATYPSPTCRASPGQPRVAIAYPRQTKSGAPLSNLKRFPPSVHPGGIKLGLLGKVFAILPALKNVSILKCTNLSSLPIGSQLILATFYISVVNMSTISKMF